jgi:hypothetical protein
MKTIIKSIGICGLICLTYYGCKKEQYGSVTIKMTDAPGDYLQVNVDIREVKVNVENTGWMNLNTQTGVYNLLALQNDVTTVLATGEHIPAGKISQIRLILGGNNTLMLADSTMHSLIIPSSEQSGVKINVHADVPPNSGIVITLDYDADKSINKEGNGSYSMRPVIAVESIY